MAGHAQLKFVMTECSKTQNRLTWLICCCKLVDHQQNKTTDSCNYKFDILSIYQLLSLFTVLTKQSRNRDSRETLCEPCCKKNVLCQEISVILVTKQNAALASLRNNSSLTQN